MLLIKILNKHTDAEGYAKYEYGVFINSLMIGRGIIPRHKRADGWKVLAQLVVDDTNFEVLEELKYRDWTE